MEKNVEMQLREKVKKAGGWALKFVSPGVRGVPDRIVLMPVGRVFFVELKSEKKKPGPIQRYIHKIFLKLGFKVYIIDTTEKVNQFINEIQST